jgi:hypothetical protein
MSLSKIEKFTCSDGSSGIIINSQMIYRTECSVRTWSSNAPNNVRSRLKLLVGKIVARVMSRFSGSRKPLDPSVKA